LFIINDKLLIIDSGVIIVSTIKCVYIFNKKIINTYIYIKKKILNLYYFKFKFTILFHKLTLFFIL